MDKHGIGTDSTIHEHIKNVQIRGYVSKRGTFLKSTLLGESLVDIYRQLGINLYEPGLRAQMEADLKAIADGQKDSSTVLKEQLNTMHEMFVLTASKKEQF
jgi:DNA topoisomerase III